MSCSRQQSRETDKAKDVLHVRVIKSKTGEMLMEEETVKQRWN